MNARTKIHPQRGEGRGWSRQGRARPELQFCIPAGVEGRNGTMDRGQIIPNYEFTIARTLSRESLPSRVLFLSFRAPSPIPAAALAPFPT